MRQSLIAGRWGPRNFFGLFITMLVVGLAAAGFASLLLAGRSSQPPRAALLPAISANGAGTSLGIPSTDGGTTPGAALTAASTNAPASAPRPGQTGSASCTDPVAGRQWRVTWRAVMGWNDSDEIGEPVADLLPTGFAVRNVPTTAADPGWQSQDDATWRLEWTPTLAQVLSEPANATHQQDGSLQTLSAVTLSVDNVPRYVTPDGGCTVYLAAFAAGAAPDDPRTAASPVAVIGDELVAQLYASDDSSPTEGALQRRLTAAGRHSAIVGRRGGRWTTSPDDKPGLASSGLAMAAQIRGLREAGSMVIALGRNDATWVAVAAGGKQYDLRSTWVMARLGDMIDELQAAGQCVVLITVADSGERRQQPAADRTIAVTGKINGYLIQRAEADPNDRLKAWNWAGVAASHRAGDPQPWFDGGQLNLAGISAFADNLARASALC